MPVKVQNGETILFIGDSITDCGRREGNPPIGRGFVKFFDDMVKIREPHKKINVINRGISGDRVNGGMAHIPDSGLINRWDKDAINLKPDWMCLMIGINDVHSNFDQRFEIVTPEVFENIYDDLMGRFVKAVPCCRLMFMEPFLMIGNEPVDEIKAKVLKLLPKYIAVVRRMSRKYGARLARTNAYMNNLTTAHGRAVMGEETVHPTQTGHFAIAELVYKTLCR